MGLENILAAIDAEIERLQSVRDLLAETTTKTSAMPLSLLASDVRPVPPLANG